MAERIGVLGGTFDPIHVGHVVVACDVRHALGLDRVLLVVAADPWQKRGAVVASGADRLAMVQAVVADIDGLEASTVDLERDGPTYTVDTVEALRRSLPDAELFLVVGADAANGMPGWERAGELAGMVSLVVVTRPGHDPSPPEGFDCRLVTVPGLEVSSSDVRARLAAGRPVDGLVPPAGVRLLRERRLYPGIG